MLVDWFSDSIISQQAKHLCLKIFGSYIYNDILH
jgi:hypothetical protein